MNTAKLSAILHPGDRVKIVGDDKALKAVKLYGHACIDCEVEEVRPHVDPRGETCVKLTCGFVAPISLLKFVRCPHVERVPAVHAFIDFKVACGTMLTPTVRFSAREEHWTCKKCLGKLKRAKWAFR